MTMRTTVRRPALLTATGIIATLLVTLGAAPAQAAEVEQVPAATEAPAPVDGVDAVSAAPTDTPSPDATVTPAPEATAGTVDAAPATTTTTTEPEPAPVDTPASDPVTVSDVLFDWGLNRESSGGSYFGGCNFLSAGTAGDTGTSRLWAQGDGFFRATDGNTAVVKPTADGDDLTQPTWATKCDAPDGTSVNGKVNASTANNHTASRVQIQGGTGTVDAAAGTAQITWDGSFTVAYYGGMTYWSATDPTLVVDADGTGTVTATLSGYAADMDDPSIWSAVPAREVVIAELTEVDVTADGFTVTPDFLGVSIPEDIAGRNPQAEKTADNASWWGAFPADFLRFQELTGQNSYWFTTAGSAASIQPRKATLPLIVEVGARTPAPVAPSIVTQPADTTVALGDTASFAVEATGRPLSYQWETLASSGEWEAVPEATGPALRIEASDRTNGAGYRVVVSNDLGAVTSERATLTIAGAPGGGTGETPTGPVQAAGAVFDWGINNESNGGSYFGGCNFLSAGVAGDTGSAKVWTESDGLYRASDGNTTIVRPGADGSGVVPASWATRCTAPDGASVNGKTTNAADSYTQSRVRISGGVGTVDPAANTADIRWTGSFTVAYYGGMTYWSASDPHLVVNADGTGTVTVTASGYGSDMDDMSKWNPLVPRTVVLAELRGVDVTAAGFSVTPEFLGVAVPADVAGRNSQATPTAENSAWWGAFPADFVRFQMDTGQSAYWWTTEGSRNSIQPRKVPLPLTVCATSDCTVPSQAATNAPASIDLSQRVLRPPNAIAAPAAQIAAVAALPASNGESVVVIQRTTIAEAAALSSGSILLAVSALLAALGLIIVVSGVGGGLFATGMLRLPPRSTH